MRKITANSLVLMALIILVATPVFFQNPQQMKQRREGFEKTRPSQQGKTDNR